MTKRKAIALLSVLLALSALPACADGSGQDRNARAADESPQPPGPPPQTGSEPTPEKTLVSQSRKVTTIRNKTVGVIANEPKYITAAVPNITRDGRTALSGNVDEEPYRAMDLRDGQDFEIGGIPFHIETYPEQGVVIVYQLADDSG